MAQLVAKRYAKALYDIVVESSQVESFQSEIDFVRNVYVNEIELSQLISQPKVDFDEKIQIIETVFKGRVRNEIVGLLILLVKKGRQNITAEVLTECLEMIKDYQGIKTAYITVPFELSEAHQGKIQKRLEALTKSTIEPIYVVDPQIIGGMIIRIGDRIVDNSLYSKLHLLAKNLKEIQLAE